MCMWSNHYCSFLHPVPSFIVRLYHTHIFTSRVYNDVRKTDALAELPLPTPIPICGDINVEFFHNPRFGRKVPSTALILWQHL